MVIEIDRIAVCDKGERSSTDGCVKIRSIGNMDMKFVEQERLHSESVKKIGVVALLVKDGRIATDKSRRLPETIAVKRDEEVSYRKDNDSIMTEVAKRLVYESNVRIDTDSLALVGYFETDDRVMFVFSAEVTALKNDFDLEFVNLISLFNSDNVPENTKAILGVFS